MSYIPKVNDYVLWNRKNVKGWVYYKGNEYLTIEAFVRQKDEIDYSHSSIHANHRLLVVCYHNTWNELKYVKTRESIYDEVSSDV